MILALTAALAIVVQDHVPLRAAPRSTATELTELWQGDLLEVRGERAGYLKVYNPRNERGGYLKCDAVRSISLSETNAPDLLAVLRFLRDTPGSEALGISYGAAYLKAVPARSLTAEPFDAIARMAERLADQASQSTSHATGIAAHLEVVEEFGIHLRTFESHGRMQVCYDGELFHRVLSMPSATPEERAHAALGLTRADCIDPDLGPLPRAAVDAGRAELLETIDEQRLTSQTRSRLHARRASVWASVTYERARHGSATSEAGQRALAELLSVRPDELGDDLRSEYIDAVLRVATIRWATSSPPMQAGPLILTQTPGYPGQTCIALEATRQGRVDLLTRRCTYGIVWMASVQTISNARALVLAVQPLESWRELWVFHQTAGTWTIDVLSPGADDPEEGYVDFAGFAPNTRRLLIAREVKERGRFHRFFEELRLDDLALVRQASTPELLRDFGRWQDIAWRRDTLALR
jgi:hypothetical protein